MMDWFDIEIEPRACLVRVAMGGFFEAATVEQLRAAFLDALKQLGCARGEHVTLCDITAMSIQSQDIVQHFGTLVGSAETRSRRLAFVTGVTLARPQARRISNHDGVAFFDDAAAARRWLAEEQPRAA